MSDDIELRLAECPICFYEMDAATSLEEPNAKPRVGDFSLCINCGALLVFEERTQLRQATDDDMQHLRPDQKAKVQIAQKIIREQRKEKNGNENHNREHSR